MTFEKIGLTVQQSQYGSIGLAAVNALMSVIAVKLVNRFRRRILLTLSTVGSSISLVILCFSISFQVFNLNDLISFESNVIYYFSISVGCLM